MKNFATGRKPRFHGKTGIVFIIMLMAGLAMEVVGAHCIEM